MSMEVMNKLQQMLKEIQLQRRFDQQDKPWQQQQREQQQPSFSKSPATFRNEKFQLHRYPYLQGRLLRREHSSQDQVQSFCRPTLDRQFQENERRYVTQYPLQSTTPMECYPQQRLSLPPKQIPNPDSQIPITEHRRFLSYTNTSQPHYSGSDQLEPRKLLTIPSTNTYLTPFSGCSPVQQNQSRSESNTAEISQKHQVKTYLQYKSYRRLVKGPTTYQSFLKFLETGSDDPEFLKKYNKHKSKQRRRKQRTQRSLNNKKEKEERLHKESVSSSCIDSLCNELNKSI